MENPNPNLSSYDDEIDLWELWETIWSGRWLIVAITGVFTLGGVAYSLLAQEWYKADVVLVPAEKKSIGGTLSQLSGLASLAGIDIPSASEQEPVAVLKSKDFARSFIEDEKLLKVILSESEEENVLDMRDAIKLFDDRVREVVEDKKTGLITLSIRWTDPNLAAQWANLLVEKLNDRLRGQALQETERNVIYLQREIAATSVISLQQTLGRVLESEMQKFMLARGNEEFAFKVIDRATPPKQRESPNRSLVTILSAFFGGVFGVFAVFLRKLIKSKPSR